jgi:hypothetical protein
MHSLSSLSPADLANHLNYYADNTPSICHVYQSLRMTKRPIRSLSRRNTDHRLWKDNRHGFVADRIYNELRKPRVRASPLEVEYPLSIKQTILINLALDLIFLRRATYLLTTHPLRVQLYKDRSQLSMYYSLKTLQIRCRWKNSRDILKFLIGLSLSLDTT